MCLFVLPLDLSLFILPKESNLFPYGEEVGDAEVQIDKEDGNSPYITPPLGFPFLGKLYYRIYVSHYESIDENPY